MADPSLLSFPTGQKYHLTLKTTRWYILVIILPKEQDSVLLNVGVASESLFLLPSPRRQIQIRSRIVEILDRYYKCLI